MRILLTLLLALSVPSTLLAAEKPSKQAASEPAAGDDDDGDVRDGCVYCSGERSLDEDEAEEHEAAHHEKWGHHDFDKSVVKGFGLTVLGGAVLRARPDLDKYGSALGPAGDPSRISGMFTAQGWMQFTPYLRLGVDFTYTNFSASGRGPDDSGTDIRQAVNYEEASGGFLAELTLPLNKQLQLSVGGVIGAGHLHVSSFATRIDDFYSAGVDMAAKSKTQSLNLDAEFFDFKPAIGLTVKATQHVAVDFRIGLKTVYVPRGSLGYASNLQLSRSPEIIELQPFVEVGASFGAWKF